MRTLGSMLPSKQYKIAGETLYIYAPLANRLGLNRIKTELEDLSFKYEHPEAYQQIEEKLKATQAERTNLFEEFTAPIREQLDKWGFLIVSWHVSSLPTPSGTRCKTNTLRLKKSMTYLPYASFSLLRMKRKN